MDVQKRNESAIKLLPTQEDEVRNDYDVTMAVLDKMFTENLSAEVIKLASNLLANLSWG